METAYEARHTSANQNAAIAQKHVVGDALEVVGHAADARASESGVEDREDGT